VLLAVTATNRAKRGKKPNVPGFIPQRGESRVAILAADMKSVPNAASFGKTYISPKTRRVLSALISRSESRGGEKATRGSRLKNGSPSFLKRNSHEP
jgi:hypothetical protein